MRWTVDTLVLSEQECFQWTSERNTSDHGGQPTANSKSLVQRLLHVTHLCFISLVHSVIQHMENMTMKLNTNYHSYCCRCYYCYFHHVR